MGPFEIVTIVVVGIAVAGVLAYLIYKKAKGQSIGCDCGSCSACPHCSACRSKAAAGDSRAHGEKGRADMRKTDK